MRGRFGAQRGGELGAQRDKKPAILVFSGQAFFCTFCAFSSAFFGVIQYIFVPPDTPTLVVCGILVLIRGLSPPLVVCDLLVVLRQGG